MPLSAYRTPGLYMEELPGQPVIIPVGTSTPGFVGEAPKADAHLNEAYAVNSWSHFVREFCPETGAKSTPLSHAVFGHFLNGGGRAYIVNNGKGKPVTGTGRDRQGLQVLETVEVEIVVCPGYTDPASYDMIATHCEQLKDRVAILDSDADADKNIDLLRTVGKPKKGEGETKPSGLRPRDSEYAALYFPWILVRDPLSDDPKLVAVSPSGHMAGLWGRVDNTRGVHKAPANEILRGALDLTYPITPGEQADLNDLGIDCLRSFPSIGIRPWGARTLAPVGSPMRYLNVRRLFNFIEQSIIRSTNWIVFEPNGTQLWNDVTRDVKNFLTTVWRDGALFGRTPEQAFFVLCNAETNTPETIDLGQVIILVGIAPIKPAEFVIFRISQSPSGAQVQTVG